MGLRLMTDAEVADYNGRLEAAKQQHYVIGVQVHYLEETLARGVVWQDEGESFKVMVKQLSDADAAWKREVAAKVKEHQKKLASQRRMAMGGI